MVAAVRLDPLPPRIACFLLLGLARPAVAAETVAASTPAAETVAPVSLKYASAAGCPTEAQFVNEVTARVRRPIRFVAEGAAIQIVVTLAQSGEQAVGRLDVERPESEPTRRDFTASSCDEVGSALALVAALALDPNARTEPLPTRAASSEASDVAATPANPVPAKPPAAGPRPASAPESRGSTAAARPAPTAARYAAWLGASAAVVVGSAPKPLALVGLGLGVRLVTEKPLSPSLQLTPLWGKTGVTGPSAASGEFGWALGRLEACPTSFQPSRRLRLDPCAALEVGRLTARGADDRVATPVTAERWWVAPGATLSVHASFSGWFVRAGALLLFPATRDEFVFHDPDQSIHQASSVVFGATLGLGFQFGE